MEHNFEADFYQVIRIHSVELDRMNNLAQAQSDTIAKLEKRLADIDMRLTMYERAANDNEDLLLCTIDRVGLLEGDGRE